jgi:hypothetical protein
VYERVKAGDEYQKMLDMLPNRVAECEDAIQQEQAQVEVKQAEKAEQVQRPDVILRPATWKQQFVCHMSMRINNCVLWVLSLRAL